MSKFPRVGSVHKLELVLFDRMRENSAPHNGQVVRVIQPYACPRNGSMGMGYVEVAETKEFIGLVCRDSLKPAKNSGK